ncbi:hypothetical protein SLS63_002249 [Diaporthe eres]|uniref:Uncharacterized protein n=1 Tax=Diaporthe eres TaxID=83184 RepID=A0ABR1PL11_DIAER
MKRVLPLRIVKRSDSTCGDDADDRPCRRCSQATTESRGSAPESVGGEQQLTVPKVRGSRNGQVFDSLGDVDESPVPLGREAYLHTAVEITATKGNGCLCDIKVDIEPTANSAVLEVIENFSAPTSLSRGSAILVLVNVELNLANYSRIRGHIRSNSDDLIEDLEDQLGSAQCEYLTVSLIYQHSAFAPGIRDTNSGVTRAQTKIRTAYTAVVNMHNAASPWSPPPAPAPNHRLLGIIAAH